jgi:hypothetical protein
LRYPTSVRESVKAAASSVPASVRKETFTNPTGEVIKPVRDNVWKVDRPFVWLGIDVGSCMVVLKLKGGCTATGALARRGVGIVTWNHMQTVPFGCILLCLWTRSCRMLWRSWAL